MQFAFDQINWLAVLACVVAGQVVLTIWFVVLFAEPWAKAYGGEGMTKAEHTKEIPGYTYAIGAFCVFLLSMGVSLLHRALQVQDIGDALQLAGLISIALFLPMAMPAYAFLKRWSALLHRGGESGGAGLYHLSHLGPLDVTRRLPRWLNLLYDLRRT